MHMLAYGIHGEDTTIEDVWMFAKVTIHVFGLLYL
jgi:hypothetical protein